ncbi:MAG: translation initiation factor IF-2, partial [Thermoanaerobaculia bacterium]|nr:translation initiation factor IF-2 [Thermoanaerobaculia bacterium]
MSRPGGPPPLGRPPGEGERVREGRERTDRDGAKRPAKRRSNSERQDFVGFRGSIAGEEDLDAIGDAAVSTGRGRRRVERRLSQGDTGPKAVSFKENAPTGPIMIGENMTVREFGEKAGIKVKDLITILFQRGILANINYVLPPELAQKLAEQLGIEAMVVSFEESVQLEREMTVGTEAGTKSPRAPVVTIMGHVDHGKTSLLDAIRESKVAESEHGGITQHIGAYRVKKGDRDVVFLDTPGHEAFTMMRARGARVTDIVVLVVAADDGVMPQTIEAIDHAKAAKVPLVVAINKIDKANANPDRVKKELSDRGLLVEEWGGETVAVPVSALKKEGIDDLLEMILLTADILALKAAPDIPAQGTVLEARKEVGRGIVSTVLVQNGTLSVGDAFVSGATSGRVRAMLDDHGNRVKAVGPSTPVE